MVEVVHYSVMKNEVVSFLKPDKPGELFIDATTGEGGHSDYLLGKYPDLNIVCLDADRSVMDVAKARLACYGNHVRFYNQWFNVFFRNYPDNLEQPDKILFDLGISSYHYDRSERGFSFMKDEPLDMRLEQQLELSAADIINSYPKAELAKIIYEYGEERLSRVISEAIVKERTKTPIETSLQLAEIIKKAVPPSYRHGRIHPATRSFQALRIAVNGELARLREGLESALSVLKVGGRIGVISFHSLEDRIVKHYFREMAKECICLPGNPICNCRGVKIVNLVTRKPVTPDEQEVAVNSPSRSSKLRVIEKVNEL